MKYILLLFLLLPAHAEWASVGQLENADAVLVADGVLLTSVGATVSLRDPFDFSVQSTFTFPGHVTDIQYESPWLVASFTKGTSSIEAVHVESGERVTWPDGKHRAPALQGATVVWISEFDGQRDPLIGNLEAFVPRPTDQHAGNANFPTFNGRYIAWEDSRSTTPFLLRLHPANMDIYMYDTVTSTTLPAAQEGIRETDPEFNGNRLAYVRDDFSTGIVEVRLMDISKSIGNSQSVATASNVQFLDWDGDALLWVDRGNLQRWTQADGLLSTKLPDSVLGASFGDALAAVRALNSTDEWVDLLAWTGGVQLSAGCNVMPGQWFRFENETWAAASEICSGDRVVGMGPDWRVGPAMVPQQPETNPAPGLAPIALIFIIAFIGKKKGL